MSNLDSRRVLVVGAGPFQLGLVRAAKDLGCEVWAVDGDPIAVGLRHADRGLVIDISDAQAVVDAVRETHLDAVVTGCSDIAIDAVVAVSEAKGLPGISRSTALRCGNKHLTACCLIEAGLRGPTTTEARSADEIRAAVAAVGGFPIVVKPRAAAGGRGVSVVDHNDDVSGALEKALQYANDDAVLVQEWIGGISVGVEAIFRDGHLETVFVMNDHYLDGFVSPVGHSLPSSLQTAQISMVKDHVRRFGGALGLSDGAANFDLRVNGNDAALIEVNARLGGNSISDLIHAAYGVDLARAVVLAALHEDTKDALRPTRERPAATRLVVNRGKGRMPDAELVSTLRGGDDVMLLELTTMPGNLVTTLVDDWSILGRCVVLGDTADHAARRASNLASQLSQAMRF